MRLKMKLVRYLEAQSIVRDKGLMKRKASRTIASCLIFTCCHPAPPPEGQVALTLREICGLTTEEIARGPPVTPATLAQRIVRAKAKIRETPIPYEVPTPQELPEVAGRGASGHLSRL